MARVHFFELEDQAWFPPLLRRYMQDFLRFAASIDPKTTGKYSARLHPAMAAMGTTKIIDLCSGGAGPVLPLLDQLETQQGYKATAVLTDLYPNIAAFTLARDTSGGRIDFVSQPVDATNVPPELQGFRMLNNSFHHFSPPMAARILADAVRQKQGITLVELVARSPSGFLAFAVALILCLVSAPFLKPFRLSRLVLTYLIPLVPLCVFFDGFVSCLRVYSVAELQALIKTIPGHASYHWDIGRLRVRKTPIKLTYLIAVPQVSIA